MWRHVASNGFTFLIVLLFLLGGVVLWGQNQYLAAGPHEEAVCVRVPSGSNMNEVSQDLEAQGAVRNGTIFRLGAEYTEKSGQLKAGSFLVPSGASMQEIVDVITRGGASTCGTEVVYRVGVTRMSVQVRELDPASGGFVERVVFNPAEDATPAVYEDTKAQDDTRFRVALAEGVTSWQVVESLKAMDILEGEVTEIPAEGMLAPDSYEVTPGASRVDILERMEAAQVARIASVWERRVGDLPISTPEEMLTLASIIEKETSVPEERRQVASVFVNRLNRGMRLQTDPTVIYGVTEGRGTLGRGIRRSELQDDNPWNTYVIDGLPITPIANPGLASLQAAVNPDETEYIFFVANGTGGHTFTRTLEEHNAAVAIWRQIEAERAAQSE